MNDLFFFADRPAPPPQSGAEAPSRTAPPRPPAASASTPPLCGWGRGFRPAPPRPASTKWGGVPHRGKSGSEYPYCNAEGGFGFAVWRKTEEFRNFPFLKQPFQKNFLYKYAIWFNSKKFYAYFLSWKNSLFFK